ncbi:MAG: hypothetical protein HC831_29665 [Chloroflexia bacterium]|nr:hypothetical protein [Chloroflexia bacterium]
MGYQSSDLVYFELNSKELYKKDKLLKQEILSIPGVENVTLSDASLINGLPGNNFSLSPDLKVVKMSETFRLITAIFRLWE